MPVLSTAQLDPVILILCQARVGPGGPPSPACSPSHDSVAPMIHPGVNYLVGDTPGIVPHGEDGQGQLGLGVAGVVAMVIVALLEEGVVRGLGRGQAAVPCLP